MNTSIIKPTTTTTTISMMTTTKCIITSHGLSFHKPGALTKFGSHSKNVVCVGNQRKKGLGVKCAGGWSNWSAGNVKKVNGGDTLQTVERSVDGSHDEAMKGFKLGTFVEDRLVYRQIFVIRSYEIGPDKTATMETLMNLLQETALNHVRSSGLASDGFGATHEMSLRKLIWVVTRIDIQVDRYSHWGDVIEIDTWVAASGKNGMRRDWVIRDPRTQNIITRATSTWVMMNRETRRLTKIPEQVRKELKPFFLDRRILLQTGVDKRIDKLNEETAEYLKSGLAPRWSDMDVNQHVNNVKYFGWILESVPLNVLEYYHLTSITLEYRRECRQSNILQSLTTMKKWGVEEKLGRAHKGDLGSTHLLRLEEDKAEIVRARAEWQAKRHI